MIIRRVSLWKSISNDNYFHKTIDRRVVESYYLLRWKLLSINIKYQLNIYKGDGYMLLSMVSIGEIKKIKELRGKDSLKSHLQSLGFLPGEKIEVVSENPSGIILLIKSTKIAINKAMANKIVVE
mgnify:CR=1 FL=1